jgi:hypothetical protein
LLWVPVEDTTAEASLAVTGDPDIWTFSPMAAAYGSYQIELRVGGVPTERRIFGIRTPANQLLIPALNERASRHANIQTDGATEIDQCEQNANDFPIAALNSFQYAGWWRSLYELYRVVEFGTGSIADHALALIKLVTIPAKSLLVNASNAVGNVATLAGSAAYQYARVNAANNALEMATLAAHASTSVVYDAATNTWQTAAKTGAVTVAQNGTTTAFGTLPAKSVLLNSTNGTAIPAGNAPAAPLKTLRSNAAFTALEWAGPAAAVELSANTVTNTVASIDLCGTTLTAPANTLVVGSRFRVTGTFRFTRGATATALNLLSDLSVGAALLTTPAIAANVTNGFSGSVEVDADLTIASTGAGGTARANIVAITDCDNVATTGRVVTNFNAALAVDTTISNNMRLFGRMTAAVAATTILATGGDIVPVN